MATGRRTKKTIKSRPKYKQERSLKTRRRKAKAAGAKKRAFNRAKKRRQARSNKLKLR